MGNTKPMMCMRKQPLHSILVSPLRTNRHVVPWPYMELLQPIPNLSWRHWLTTWRGVSVSVWNRLQGCKRCVHLSWRRDVTPGHPLLGRSSNIHVSLQLQTNWGNVVSCTPYCCTTWCCECPCIIKSMTVPLLTSFNRDISLSNYFKKKCLADLYCCSIRDELINQHIWCRHTLDAGVLEKYINSIQRRVGLR